jgi:peptidoglycan/xylan/chitin deacetylase (PgdA/CDA1 family)
MVELILAASYALFLNLSNKKPRRVVLYYHSVNKADVIGFKKQMAYLAKNYSVLKASEIITASTDGADTMVAITFDDAFVSIKENAVPILKEHDLPAAIFVPAGNLGQHPRWDIRNIGSLEDGAIMSHEQIAELDNNGFEIFSHTLSHPVLTEAEDGRLEAELVGSKHALEKIVDHEVLAVSYPHGAYNAKVCKAAQRAGYKLGFTVDPGMVDTNTDCLRIGRFSVSPRDNLIKFKLKAKGAYQAVKFLRAIKALLLKCF